MNRNMPGLPVHHQLPEFTQTHVPQVGDAIQPSHPLLSPSLPAPIPPSIRVFSSESTLCMRWPKYWSFSFSISPSSEYPGLISLGWTGWISLQSKGLSRVFYNTTHPKMQSVCWHPIQGYCVQSLFLSPGENIDSQGHWKKTIMTLCGHSIWLFSCSLYIPCPTRACFVYTLLTWLNFLHICPRPQLVIVLIKGAVRGLPLYRFPW